VVEGRFELAPAATPATTAAPAALASLAGVAVAVVLLLLLLLLTVFVSTRAVAILVLFVLFVLLLLVLGRERRRLDLGLDLVAKIVGVVGLAVGRESVAAAEVSELRGGDLELVGDPSVRAALADPGADLVQLCPQ
jgi:TctA family transporter